MLVEQTVYNSIGNAFDESVLYVARTMNVFERQSIASSILADVNAAKPRVSAFIRFPIRTQILWNLHSARGLRARDDVPATSGPLVMFRLIGRIGVCGCLQCYGWQTAFTHCLAEIIKQQSSRQHLLVLH